MRVDDFDFHLPESNIALHPAKPRDTARMLVVGAKDDGVRALADRFVRDLPGSLRAGDALVFNDTKVIPAQLTGIRERDGEFASVAVTLHMRVAPDRWLAFVRGAKKLKPRDLVRFGDDGLSAHVEEKHDGGEILFHFSHSGDALDAALQTNGHIPLPPYITAKRDVIEADKNDYQTIYAQEAGAVAAPTAGLHFTPKLFDALDKAGISRHFVTLHVGAGTFLPVKVDDTRDHKMHAEIGSISRDTADQLNKVRASGGRIICVGTTSLRLLESAIEPNGEFAPWSGSTNIFITPGYTFRAADALMTNFHLPRSTLFMLVSAFSGLKTMRDAYTHAISQGYRFYSYGDSSLLFRDHKHD